MASALPKTAQNTWRRLDAQDLLPLVRTSVVFKDGQPVDRTGARSEQHSGMVAV